MDNNVFFRGGGRIPWWASALSIYATIISSVTFLTIPAKSYATDWTYYPMLLTIPVVGLVVSKYYLPYFHKLKVTSAYECLEQRFNRPTRLAASALFSVYLLARMALVLYLPALVINTISGISMEWCILTTSIITITYSAIGGIRAIVWADVVQGLTLMGGAIFCAIYLIINTKGGAEGFWHLSMAHDKMQLFDWSMAYDRPTWWVIILGGLAGNLVTYTSDQSVIQRYMTSNSVKDSSHSIFLHAWMYIISSLAFYAIGTGLYTFYQSHGTLPEMVADKVFPYFLSTELSPAFTGIVVTALFCASMSTVSSNINSIASCLCTDFKINLPRTITIVSGIMGMCIALMMTTWHINSLLDYFNTIIGLLTSGLGGLFFMAVFMPKVSSRGALTGFICGQLAVFACWQMTDVNFFLYSVIGLFVSVTIAYLITKI